MGRFPLKRLWGQGLQACAELHWLAIENLKAVAPSLVWLPSNTGGRKDQGREADKTC